jgi:hypothetical protein
MRPVGALVPAAGGGAGGGWRQHLFFRRADFLAVGGCDPTLLVMEEADLCIRRRRQGQGRDGVTGSGN